MNWLINYSRMIDYDDWMLRCSSGWTVSGDPTVLTDFASPWNSRYNSRFWAPGTEAVDALPVLGMRRITGGFHHFI